MTSKASIPVTESRSPKSRVVFTVVLLSLVGWIAPMGSARAQVLGDTTVIGPNSGVNNYGAVSLNEVAGVGKADAEIRLALEAGIFSFHVESEPELVRIGLPVTAVMHRLSPEIAAPEWRLA